MLRELMQNLVDAEKVGSEHLVEISLFTDTHSSHHMKTTLDDVVDRAAASSEVSSSDITVNSTLVIHETGYAGLTGPMQQITPFKNASEKDHFHNFFFKQSKRSKAIGSGGEGELGK